MIENNIVTNNYYGLASGGSAQRYFNNSWNNIENFSNTTPTATEISVDPLYVDFNAKDFHLQSGSPCKTASSSGDEIGAYGNGGNPPSSENTNSPEPEISVNLDGKAVSGSLILDADNPGDTLHMRLSGTVYLEKNGVNVAVWRGLEETFNLLPARWEDPDGNLITDWSQILTETTLTPFRLIVELNDQTTATSNIFNIKYQNTLNADFTFDKISPQTGPDVEITATSSITGADYTYLWRLANGHEIDTQSEVTTQLGSGALWGPVAIILQIEDSSGNISFKKKWFIIDRPYSRGNPSAENIPASNGVALFNGNLYRQFTDMTVANRGVDFILSRSFNTNVGWRFNYSQSIAGVVYNCVKSVRIKQADGKDQGFFKAEDGLWYPYNRTFDILIENSDRTFTLYTKGSIRYHFASTADGGKLQKISDRNDNELTLTYGADGYLDYIADTHSRQYNFTYDVNSGNLLSVTDHTGRQVLYTWVDDRLTFVTDVRGNISQYGYDDNGYLTRIFDPLRNSVEYEYDTNGRVTAYTNENSITTTYEYGTQDGTPAAIVTLPISNGQTGYWFDKRGRLKETINALNYKSSSLYKEPQDETKVADALLPTETTTPRGYEEGFKTIYAYSSDGRGNLLSVVDPENLATALQWQTKIRPADENLTNQNLLKKRTPPGIGGNSYDYSYTTEGNLSQLTDPLNRTANMIYNAFGQIESKTDPEQNQTNYTYNAQGYIETITDTLGNTRHFTRDALGRATAIKDKRGNTTLYNYDAAGNVRMIVDPLGNVTVYSYDANGNRTAVVDPRGNATNYTYTKDNKSASVTVTVNGISYTQSYIYDALNRVVSVTNRNNHTRSNSYDLIGNVTSRTDPLSNTVSYTYDKNGNVKTKTDADGRTLTYTYDKLDRVISVTDNLNQVESYTYNDQGLKATHTDKRDLTTHYQYDDAGQLTQVTDPNGGVSSLTYDNNGNKATVTDPEGHTVTYSYDQLNRLIALQDHDNHTWTYTYDKNGNLLDTHLPDGSRTQRQYDANNRVTAIAEYNTSDALIRTVSFTYDANGNVLSKSDGNSTLQYTYDELNRIKTLTDHFGKTIAYAYDGVGNLTALTYPGNKTVTYGYDNAERLQNVTDWLNHTTAYSRNQNGQITQTDLGNGTRISRQYDAVGRLISLINETAANQIISDHQMTLDQKGNITHAIADLPLLPRLPAGTTMSYDNTNRLLQADDVAFTHDPNGRIIEQTQTGDTIEYHFNTQDLITRIVANGSTADEYIYDAADNRVARFSGGAETRFIVDANASLPRVLAETDSSGAVKRYYIYGEGLISQIDASGNTRYYHYDPTGNTLALTDAAQNITDRYAYTPYGFPNKQGSTPNPFLYSGKQGVMDDGNGLNYMRARYYKPGIRRFLSLDVLLGDVNEPQSLNRYAYVQGNPIMGIDPGGMQSSVYDFFYNMGGNSYKALKRFGYIKPAIGTYFWVKDVEYKYESKELLEEVCNKMKDAYENYSECKTDEIDNDVQFCKKDRHYFSESYLLCQALQIEQAKDNTVSIAVNSLEIIQDVFCTTWGNPMSNPFFCP